MNLFLKISDKFQVDWDLDKIESLSKLHPPIYTDDQGKFTRDHKDFRWIYFKSKLCLTQNFSKWFPDETSIFLNKFKQIQEDISKKETLFNIEKKFLNHTPEGRNLEISKIFPGNTVDIHRDWTRHVALNIGLKNSNTHEIFVSECKTVEDFNSSQKQSYIMQDGDAYFLKSKYYHTVCPILPITDKVRYIISYNLF